MESDRMPQPGTLASSRRGVLSRDTHTDKVVERAGPESDGARERSMPLRMSDRRVVETAQERTVDQGSAVLPTLRPAQVESIQAAIDEIEARIGIIQRIRDLRDSCTPASRHARYLILTTRIWHVEFIVNRRCCQVASFLGQLYGA